MGKIAQMYAEKVIITNDNPRDENPTEIRRDILLHCPDAVEVEDRKEAIEKVYNQQTKTLLAIILCKVTIWYDHMLFIDLVNIISREFCSAKDVYYNILQLFGIAGLGAMV
ncbi:unnamed protein product [Ceratitis capitata]|uniref:(Mediterranean fruit fly) hypothetical protein n=1 Tax=Ceratitis capitata TaxID=7213 RepID=A0A811V779_CERCA|nr:unnamed protein product [Ceratitis capitata]